MYFHNVEFEPWIWSANTQITCVCLNAATKFELLFRVPWLVQRWFTDLLSSLTCFLFIYFYKPCQGMQDLKGNAKSWVMLVLGQVEVSWVRYEHHIGLGKFLKFFIHFWSEMKGQLSIPAPEFETNTITWRKINDRIEHYLFILINSSG